MGLVAAVSHVAVVVTETRADLANGRTVFIVKYRRSVILLALDILEAAVAICNLLTKRLFGCAAGRSSPHRPIPPAIPSSFRGPHPSSGTTRGRLPVATTPRKLPGLEF